MKQDALGQFLDKTVSYERWRAPLDPGLRHGVILSGISIFTTFLCLLALPYLLAWGASDFFLVLQSQFLGILIYLQPWQTALITFNLISLFVYLALLMATQQLQAGRAVWHQVAFAEVSIGAINGLILALEMAIVVINIVVWIIGIFIVFSALGAALAGAGK